MRKAQSLVISMIVLLVAFSVVVTLFVVQWQQLRQKEDRFKELAIESGNVGSMLISSPIPDRWDEFNIKKVGLVKNDKLDFDYLVRYKEIDYPKSKMILGLRDDYLFFIQNGTEDSDIISINGLQYWGWNGQEKNNGGTDLANTIKTITNSSRVIAKNERFIEIEQNGRLQHAKLITYVWEFVDGNFTYTEKPFEFTIRIIPNQQVFAKGQQINITIDPMING